MDSPEDMVLVLLTASTYLRDSPITEEEPR